MCRRDGYLRPNNFYLTVWCPPVWDSRRYSISSFVQHKVRSQNTLPARSVGFLCRWRIVIGVIVESRASLILNKHSVRVNGWSDNEVMEANRTAYSGENSRLLPFRQKTVPWHSPSAQRLNCLRWYAYSSHALTYGLMLNPVISRSAEAVTFGVHLFKQSARIQYANSRMMTVWTLQKTSSATLRTIGTAGSSSCDCAAVDVVVAFIFPSCSWKLCGTISLAQSPI